MITCPLPSRNSPSHTDDLRGYRELLPSGATENWVISGATQNKSSIHPSLAPGTRETAPYEHYTKPTVKSPSVIPPLYNWVWLLYTASPQQGDLRILGPQSDQGAGSGASTRDRRVPEDLRADSLATVPPTPPPDYW
ncbi:hypothetical protein PoB_005814500 [Plakobranchus ocellatus]|uniref:Uncharacterized protein n=1 Tax=Plakobranchus ocellatus TaxID=259542 RepID=A0AAV4CIK8_9GAST|nr:hypothetical protein PoB_005814500 [Plakobranchus ocellatus]